MSVDALPGEGLRSLGRAPSYSCQRTHILLMSFKMMENDAQTAGM